MTGTGILWLRVATLLYAVGLVHSLWVLLRRNTGLFQIALVAFCVGVTVHFIAVIELTTAIGRFPVDNFFETSSLCALLIGLAFLFVYWRYRFASLSVCIFPLVFLMTQIGAMEVPVSAWPNTGIRDALLLIHVVMVLLGFAALLLMATGSMFYLIQERQLKSKKPGTFFDRLPPLATLDNLISHSMSFGFVFMTVGVIAGSAWAFIESGISWIGDPRIAISLLTWLVYLVMVFLRATAGWRGRKAAFMAIAVLCCSAITWATHFGLRTLLAK
ncbi:MAG: cytochrome C assembly family protein [Bryobacteraceae bacterium]